MKAEVLKDVYDYKLQAEKDYDEETKQIIKLFRKMPTFAIIRGANKKSKSNVMRG